ncbi:hypothetical protein BH09PLA1_BH09PLA1_13320 [soil metagenome]
MSTTTRTTPRRAFTLVEVLIVIGIIGVLIGVLIPVVARARRQAQRVACASNLRQIGGLAQNWAAEHHGYLPLDGEVEIPIGTQGRGSLPRALEDVERRRYGYHYDKNDPYPIATLDRPMPFFVALLSSTIRGAEGLAKLKPDAKWSITESHFPQALTFRCPAAWPRRQGADYPGWVDGVFEGGPTLYLVTGNLADGTIWHVNVDFATNGGLLGFHFDRQFHHRRYRAHLSAVRNSARMVLCADTAGWAPGWIPALARPTRHVTLADAWQATVEVPFPSPLDPKRHQGQLNVLFVDGHVELIKIDKRSLEACDLLQP